MPNCLEFDLISCSEQCNARTYPQSVPSQRNLFTIIVDLVQSTPLPVTTPPNAANIAHNSLATYTESSKSIWGILDIENRSRLFALYSIVLEHARVHASILTFKLESWRGGLGVENKVVVAVRAILVTARGV